MSEQAHTKTPWRLRNWPTGQPNIIEGDLANAEGPDWHGEWVCIFQEMIPEARERQKANARRIVACVNALEGVSQEALEYGGRERAVMQALVAERDRLLAERQKLIELAAGFMSVSNHALFVDAARALLDRIAP